jgi:hypothetical protein
MWGLKCDSKQKRRLKSPKELVMAPRMRFELLSVEDSVISICKSV